MAEATIDSLAIEIGASSNDAVQAINKLSGALGNLRKSVSGGAGLSALAKELNAFKKDLTSLGKMKIDSSLSNSINKVSESINKLDIEKLKSLSGALSAMKGASSIELSVKGLSSLAKLNDTINANPKAIKETTNQLAKISELDFSNIETAAKGIREIANSAKTIMDSGAKTKDVPKSVGTSVGEAARQAADKTQTKWRDATSKIIGFFANLQNAEKNLGKGVDFSKMAEYDKAIRSANANIAELNKKIQELRDKMPGATDAQKEALELQIGSLQTSISEFNSAKMQLQQSMKSNLGLTVLASALKSVGSMLKSVVTHALSAAKALGGKFLSAVKSAATAAGNLANNIVVAPFRRFADTISRLKKRLDNLGSSFARIMFYRAIRTVIKEIGNAMKYGEENAYWFSKKFGEATRYISEAYDAYMSATEMMKNQAGAAWATLFANIQPIIEAITDLVARAAEVVTQFFAALGGKTTYLKATKYAKDWKDETESATKAAKEWRNQILGFDEINRLDEQSDNNGSKKSGKKTPDYSQMFEEVAVESEIGDLANKMKDLWNKQDWVGLGELISGTLNDLFPSREKWEAWGTKIGTYINGAIQTAYNTLKGIDFGTWGENIASGVNKALEEIDFMTWGRLLIRKVTSMIDFVMGFIKDLHFDTVGKSIGDFFRGAFDEATEWLSTDEWGNKFSWSETSAKLWEKLKSLINGFDIPSFASSLGALIVTAVNSAADFLNGIDFTDVVNTVIGSLKTFFSNLRTDEIRTAISNLWEAIKKAFKDTMTTFGNWLHGKNEEGAFSGLGKKFNDGLIGFINEIKELSGTVPWDEIGTAIGDFMKEIHWKEIFEGVWESVKPYFKAAVDWFFSENGEVVRHLAEKVIGLKIAFDMAGPVLGGAVSALVLRILNPFKGLAPGISAAGAAAGTTLSEKLSPLAGTASKALSNVGTAVKTGVANATTWLTSGMTEFTVAGKTLMTGAAATIGTAALGVTDAVMVAYDYEKLKEVSDTYVNQQDAFNNEVKTKMDGFKKLWEDGNKDAAYQYAQMVAGVDVYGQDLTHSLMEIAASTRKQYEDIPKSMSEGFRAGWREHFDNGGTVWTLIGNGFKGVVDWAKEKLKIGKSGGKSAEFEDMAKKSAEGLETGWKGEIPKVETEWSKDVEKLPESVSSKLGIEKGGKSKAFSDIGKYSAEGLNEGWKTAIDGAAEEWAQDIDELPKAARNQLGIESPSKVFKEIGEFTVAGLLEGLQSKWADIENFFNESVPKLTDKVKGVFDKLKTSTSETWNSILTNATSSWNKMVESASKATSNIAKAFENAWQAIPKGIQTVFDKIKTWWNGNVSQLFTAKYWTSKVEAALSGFKATVHNSIIGGLTDIIPQAQEKFKTVGRALIDGIKNGFSEQWSTFANIVSDKIQALASLISQKVSSVIQSMKDTMNAAADSIRGTWETLRTGTQNAINQAAEAVNNFIAKAKSALHVKGYASGGFPSEGQMFIAREAGPELVGTIGNRSAVANNDQIVSAVAAGVASANEDVVNAIYTVGSQMINAIADSASRNGGQPDWRSISRMITEQQTQRATALGA